MNGGFTADTTLNRYPSNAPVSFPPHLFVNYTGHLGPRACIHRLRRLRAVRIDLAVELRLPRSFRSPEGVAADFYFQPNLSIEIVPIS